MTTTTAASAAWIGLVAYAKASGLSRNETSTLYALLMTQELPSTVDRAWVQLDDALQQIQNTKETP